MSNRDRAALEESMAVITAESTEYKGVDVSFAREGIFGDSPTPERFIPILSDEERKRRHAVAHEATLATVRAEAVVPPVSRKQLEERLRDEQVETLKAEMAGGKKSLVFGG